MVDVVAVETVVDTAALPTTSPPPPHAEAASAAAATATIRPRRLTDGGRQLSD
ncbi:MAG: hypothetical protein R2710_16600 [Acidimicrobiales bacterium]